MTDWYFRIRDCQKMKKSRIQLHPQVILTEILLDNQNYFKVVKEDRTLLLTTKASFKYPLVDHAKFYIIPGKKSRRGHLMVCYAYDHSKTQEQLANVKAAFAKKNKDNCIRATTTMPYTRSGNPIRSMVKLMIFTGQFDKDEWDSIEKFIFDERYESNPN